MDEKVPREKASAPDCHEYLLSNQHLLIPRVVHLRFASATFTITFMNDN